MVQRTQLVPSIGMINKQDLNGIKSIPSRKKYLLKEQRNFPVIHLEDMATCYVMLLQICPENELTDLISKNLRDL